MELEETKAWLLEPTDSAVRAQALIPLLDYHPDVKAAQREPLIRGSIAQVLDGLLFLLHHFFRHAAFEQPRFVPV